MSQQREGFGVAWIEIEHGLELLETGGPVWSCGAAGEGRFSLPAEQLGQAVRLVGVAGLESDRLPVSLDGQIEHFFPARVGAEAVPGPDGLFVSLGKRAPGAAVFGVSGGQLRAGEDGPPDGRVGQVGAEIGLRLEAFLVPARIIAIQLAGGIANLAGEQVPWGSLIR